MIVVTTPTGQIGTHVARELIEAGKPVRLVVRAGEKLRDAVKGRAEVIEGSHVQRAIIDRVYH